MARPIEQNTYFRRYIIIGNQKLYSAPVLVQLKHDGGCIAGDTNDINSSTVIQFVSKQHPLETCSYTWEKRVENDTLWQTIVGATARDLSISGITKNTWFRRKVTINNQGYYSNECLARTNPRRSETTLTSIDPSTTVSNYRKIKDVTYYDRFRKGFARNTGKRLGFGQH